MLGERPAAAVLPAHAQRVVERVEGLAVHPPDGDVAEQGADVLSQGADVLSQGAFIPGARGLLDVQDRHVAVEHLPDGRRGSRLALLVDLGEQSRSDLLGLGRRGRPRRNDLGEVVPLLRHRIESAYTRTRSDPLGSVATSPRWRLRRPVVEATRNMLSSVSRHV